MNEQRLMFPGSTLRLMIFVTLLIFLSATVKSMAQKSERETKSNVTLENFQKIATYAETSMNIGGISSVYSFEVGKIHGQYRPACRIGETDFPERIKICEGDQCFEMRLQNVIEWNHSSTIKLDKDEQEKELYSLITKVISEIEK